MSSQTPSFSLPDPPDELARLSEQLCNRIGEEIDNGGPMPFERYMNMALYEPGLGYYVNGLHKFGRAGDFVTAPEQGRLFAGALANQADEIAGAVGADGTILELGAGSGVLARDLLLAMKRPPERYLILETSAALREVQAETLAALPPDLHRRVAWIDQPPAESFDGLVLANEVMDALPTARFAVTGDGLLEQCVTRGENRFAWSLQPPRKRLEAAFERVQASLPETLPAGYESEICLDLPGWLETISEPLGRGALILIDYGYPRAEYYHSDRRGGTLVCHYRHRAHFDPFVWPGLTDISAFVDFTACAEAAGRCGLEVSGFTSQAGFLLSLGVAESIEQATDERERMALAGEIKRLTLPGEMGEKFKVLALTRGLDQDLSGFGMMSQLHRL